MARYSTTLFESLGGLTLGYIREDIYYCSGCAQFFDELTDKLVEVSYKEMPTDFAEQVKRDRQRKSKCGHSRRKPKWKKPPANGFGNI